MPDNKTPGPIRNGDLAAFPGSEEWAAVGLSKREWFAGQALRGVLSRTDFELFNDEDDIRTAAWIAASNACIIADAMLEQLEEKES